MLLRNVKPKPSIKKCTNSRLSAGAFGRGATPVTIPNTEVKSPCAYGTAGFPGGRVGQCRHSIVGVSVISRRVAQWESTTSTR